MRCTQEKRGRFRRRKVLKMVDVKWDKGEGGKEKELNDSGEMHEGKKSREEG